MDITIHASFLPHDDPDAALAFYRDTLGFEVRNDVGYAGMRWITVGPADQPGTSIVLHPPGADPGVTDDERRTIVEMMAKGTYGAILMATADLDATFERLQGVAEVVQEPTEQPYGVRDCALRDRFGAPVDRSKTEHNDAAGSSRFGFGRISRVQGPHPVKLELPFVGHTTAGTVKQPEHATSGVVSQDRRISALHFLIAALAFAGVVKATVVTPTVEVAMGLSRSSFRKDHHVRRASRWRNTALAATAVALVERRSLDHLAGLQRPDQRTPEVFDLGLRTRHPLIIVSPADGLPRRWRR